MSRKCCGILAATILQIMTELVSETTNAAPKASNPGAFERVIIRTNRKKATSGRADFPASDSDVTLLSQKMKDPSWFARKRKTAWAAYRSMPMPTLSDEAWRRTDLRPLRWNDLRISALDRKVKPRKLPAALLKPLAGHAHGGQVAINGGRVESRKLAASLKRKGVIFTDIHTAIRDHEKLVKKHLGRAVSASDGRFAAMTEALMDGGVFLYVPRNVQVDLPLHSVINVPGSSHFTRLLVVLEDGASVTYVSELTSPSGARSENLHTAIVELLVGRKATLKFVELQSLNLKTWNITHERARIQNQGRLDWVFNAVGSHLTKNFSTIELDGEHSWARMSGFYFAEKDQHLDHDTQQNHNVPNTTSDLLFKGALRDQGRSVWQGMIYVAPGAQKTDGYQANRNLVLSKTARADSIPGLEIMADDVRCTHGATVGQLEQEHIFYLMSRGMPRAEAEKLVVDGFFDPIMQRIPFPGVIHRLKKDIERKMSESTWGQ